MEERKRDFSYISMNGACSELFFVYLADPESKATDILSSLVQEVENAAFCGVRPFGVAYENYAAWDGVWLPPLVEGESSERALQFTAAVGFSLGVWSFVTGVTSQLEWIPFMLPWNPEATGALPIFMTISTSSVVPAMLPCSGSPFLIIDSQE